MIKVLSKSVIVMFIFDLIVLAGSTIYWYNYFELPAQFLSIVCILTVFAGLAALFLKDNYKIREFNINFKNSYLLFEGIVFAMIPSSIFLYLMTMNFNFVFFIIANLFSIWIITLLYRFLFHFYLFNLKRSKNVLIVGSGKNAKVISDLIENKKALKMKVAGFFEYEDLPSGYDVINTKLEELNKKIKDSKADILIFTVDEHIDEFYVFFIMSDYVIPDIVKVYKMHDFYEMANRRYYVDDNSMKDLFYYFQSHKSKVYDFCKRAFDIIAALIILTVTLPVTITVAVRVWLTDKASPIYTQERVGFGGKVFKCYKLRTMYVNNYVPKDGQDIKFANSVNSDSRVIPFCKFVRKARFDEIPQMINILKGEMSIVGPRAEWKNEVNIFEKEIPYYRCRMWVKTGWTGWSHINMNPCFSLEDEKVRLSYDLYYLKHRNVIWEIGILIKAVFLALGGRHK